MPRSRESVEPGASDAELQDDELAARIDRLYQLPRSEFTAARNALAQELRAAGDRAAADRIKHLGKPSVTAWVVNRLWWQARKDVETLLQAGNDLRLAQLGGRAAWQADASKRRRDALRSLSSLAETILGEAGSAASASTMRRITTNLEALAAHGTRPPEPGPGRYVEDLQPPGFELLAGGHAEVTPEDLGGSPMQRSESIVEARPDASAEDELALRRAEAAVQTADRNLRVAAATTVEARARAQRAREAATRAREVLDAAKRRADEASVEAAAAQAALQTCEDAQREATERERQARAALQRLRAEP